MSENPGVLALEGDAAGRWLSELPSLVHPTPASGHSLTESARARSEADPAHLVELLTRCSCGQEEALAELYDLTSSRIYGIVLRVVRSAVLAAEVTQEVYLEVWRQSARSFPGNGHVLGWVMTMAHRKAVDHVRVATT